MGNILTIAYSVEGTTDVRFLDGIIQRTFEEIAYNSETDIEVYPLIYIPYPKLNGIVENVTEIARIAFNNGIHVLCIHVDADNIDEKNALQNRINPAFAAVQNIKSEICKNLVAIIPVQMTESWMLADKEIFKEEITSAKSNQYLGIARKPETIADPKQVIEEAIRTEQTDHPRKNRQLTINDLYQPLGQKIPLRALELLNSYMLFQQSVENSFRRLNYFR